MFPLFSLFIQNLRPAAESQLLFFHYCYASTYVCVHTYTYLHSFSVPYICICLELTFWNWITYQETTLWETDFSLSQAILNCLNFFTYEYNLLRFAPCWLTYQLVCDYAILFRQHTVGISCHIVSHLSSGSYNISTPSSVVFSDPEL